MAGGDSTLNSPSGCASAGLRGVRAGPREARTTTRIASCRTPRLSSFFVLDEIRITGLGVISDATLPLGAGLTVITGETGAGKTMVVTSLGLLFGGRADGGRVRADTGRAVVEGRLRLVGASAPVVQARVEEAGGE